MGQIKVKAKYIDKDSISDIESAGYKVEFKPDAVIKHYVISSDEDSADEIIDALRENGWKKIDVMLIHNVKESALDRALAVLAEEKKVYEYSDIKTAKRALLRFKDGHSLICKTDGDKTVYGIVYGGKPKGWSYCK